MWRDCDWYEYLTFRVTDSNNVKLKGTITRSLHFTFCFAIIHKSMEKLIIIAIEHINTWEPHHGCTVEVSFNSDLTSCEPRAE